MTVENTQNKMPPLQMGTTSEYPFTFAVLLQDPTEEEALEAIKASVLQADGTEIELVYNTDYTVTLNTDRIGGTLTVNDIRTSSDYITIYRRYEQTQEVDYKDFNSAPAETFEQCFDKLTMLSQQQQEEINRSIKLPVSSEITDLSLPNPIAGRTLKWNESETGLINSDVSIDEIDEFVQTAVEASANATEQAEIASEAAEEAVEKGNEINNVWNEIVEGNMFKYSLFDTILKDHVLTYEESNGWALQGTYVYKEAIAGSRYGYPDFYAKCLEEYNQATTTETVNGVTVKVYSNGHKFYNIADKTAIDDFFNTMGYAWFYGVDTANERIFLPRDNYFAVKGVAPVVGNGMTLGMTDGELLGGLLQNHASNYTYLQSFTGSYGLTVGSAGGGGSGLADNKVVGVTTDATKSGIEAHLETNEDKYLYICVGNTVADTSWVDVVTQVEGGVKDLEDKTLEGIERLRQSSTALTQTQITNCLLEVPQRIKYTLENGTLTIKAGSVVIVPYGTEDLTAQYPVGSVFINNNFRVYDTQFAGGKFFVWVEVQSDIVSLTSGNTNKVVMPMGINLSLNVTDWGNRSESGTNTTSSLTYTLYYNTNTNLVGKANANTTLDFATVRSFPILTVLNSGNNSWSAITVTFNGMGYIGSTIWVDKGVKGLIPNGRNEDGTLNNIEFNNNKLATYTTTDNVSSEYYISLNTDYIGRLQTIAWEYKQDKNQILGIKEANLNMVTKNCIAGLMTLQNGVVTSFQPKLPFRAIDYSDKSEVSGWGMPSNKYINLTLGASDVEYTAPANGYLYVKAISKTSSGSGNSIFLANSYGLATKCIANANSQPLYVYLPVAKNDIVQLVYTTQTPTEVKFFYAQGEV